MFQGGKDQIPQKRYFRFFVYELVLTDDVALRRELLAKGKERVRRGIIEKIDVFDFFNGQVPSALLVRRDEIILKKV